MDNIDRKALVDTVSDWATRLRTKEDEKEPLKADPWALRPAERNTAFLSSLVVVRAPVALSYDGHDVEYTVCLPYYVKVEIQGGTVRRYRVPAGAVTDFASVPQPFRLIIGRIGRWTEASVVHDAAYRGDLEKLSAEGKWVTWTGNRKEADQILRTLMSKAGVSWWERYVINLGVWLGGGRAWSKNRTEPTDPSG